jgi:uncharacterized protein YdeI (YjbR/CyaY-like superfamily)
MKSNIPGELKTNILIFEEKISKRMILGWIHNAKKPETRQTRIEETVSLATDNIKANQ